MQEQRQKNRGKDKDKEEFSGRYEISPLDSKLNPLFVFYALQNHQKEKTKRTGLCGARSASSRKEKEKKKKSDRKKKEQKVRKWLK